MSTLTISNSGTAWIRDNAGTRQIGSRRLGQQPERRLLRLLDTDHPLPKPVSDLPTTFAELLKAHGVEKEDPQLPAVQTATSGHRINVTA